MQVIEAGGSRQVRSLLLAGAAGIAFLASGTARAQEQDPSATDMALPAEDEPQAIIDGNAIIVTATKREQTLQDVPVAVTVTSAATIEAAQIRDLKDLASVVPSLRVVQLQSSASTNFIIRGFGNGANNLGIEPSVGVFIDGVYRSRSAAQLADFPDVERIEVLRGPQSTLFGKNASVGVVSIVTQAPRFEPGGSVEASYGNYDAVVLKGTVTGPMSDTVAVSMAGGYNRRDGYNRDLGTGSRTNDRDRWFVRGQALWVPDSQLHVRLIGDFGRIDENCCAAINLQPSAATAAIRALGGAVNTVDQRYANVVYGNLDSTNRIDNSGLSAQADYDIGPLKITSITAWRQTDALTDQDSDFTSLDILGHNRQDLRIRTFTQELRVATTLEGPLNFLVGAYYHGEDIDQTNQVQFGRDFRRYGNALLGGTPGTDNTVASLEQQVGAITGRTLSGQFFAAGQGLDERYRLNNDAFSVFAQADVKLGDRLTLTGGVNYTRDTKRYSATVASSDVFSGLDLVAVGRAGLAQQFVSSAVGTAQGLGRGATAAEVDAFAAANAAAYAAIAAQAGTFGALNANLSTAAAAADGNPLTVGNPLLAARALQVFPPFLGVPNSVEPGRTRDGKFTWIARAAYDLTDAINLYASYATGFKASSINLSRDSRPLAEDAAALGAASLTQINQAYGTRSAGPENSSVYEAGLKADWGDVTVNLAAFRQSITGFQSNVFTGTGFVLANAGKQSVTGFELEGTARPVQGLGLSMALTYLKGRYDSFRRSAVGDLSGTTPAQVPAISVTWAASYDHPLPGDHHLIARADFHYETPTAIQEGLPGFLSGGTAAAIAATRPFRREVNDLNASLTWAMPSGLELIAWGRNLTDARYLLNIFDSPIQPRSISGYTSQPRTYGVAARYRF